MRGGGRAPAIALAAAAVALVPGAASGGAPAARTTSASPARPHIVWKPIPFGPARRAEMARYSRMHYTASSSFSATYNTVAADSPDPELGQLPGTCAHFVVDTDGTIYQLVSTGVRCRHTVGLNWTAIGIEHVGTSDAQILSNRRQLGASLRLTRWLMARTGITLRNVIGHSESVTSRYHRELYKPWATQTHGDWSRADMDVYRARLRALGAR